jgi:hypothetical protein
MKTLQSKPTIHNSYLTKYKLERFLMNQVLSMWFHPNLNLIIKSVLSKADRGLTTKRNGKSSSADAEKNSYF